MSKIEVNTVAPQCGTTLTLGESGDTVVPGPPNVRVEPLCLTTSFTSILDND